MDFFKKNFKTLAIIAGVLFLVWKLKGLFSKEPRVIFSVNQLLTSKSKEELENIADAQYIAMAVSGTEEEPLFESLKGLNKYDLKEVYNKFGNREYFLFGKAEQGVIGESLNLFEWYNKELGIFDLPKMRNFWKEKTGLIF